MPNFIQTASINSYCQCTSPKIMDLLKDKNKMTDKEWYEKMDTISNDCAGNVEVDSSATEAKKEKESTATAPQ